MWNYFHAHKHLFELPFNGICSYLNYPECLAFDDGLDMDMVAVSSMYLKDAPFTCIHCWPKTTMTKVYCMCGHRCLYCKVLGSLTNDQEIVHALVDASCTVNGDT